MAVARTPRARWIEEGFTALAAGGPDAVRVEQLAQTLGVTKGGFYWHFDGRGALLVEMLETWERLVVDDVIQDLESQGGDAREKLQRLFALAVSLGGLQGIELAIREWARRDEGVADRLRRVDNRRMDYLRSQFTEICRDADEVEVRCMLAFTLFIGSHFMVADHAGRTRAQVLELTLQYLVAS